MKKTFALIALLLSLLACATQPIPNTATEIPATVTEVPPTYMPVPPTQTPPPSLTPEPSATNTPSLEPVAYYYFVDPTQVPYPEQSIIVMAETYILAPTHTDGAFVSEPAAALRSALEITFQDSRNGWLSNQIQIVSLIFNSGHAEIVMQGEYFGVGDVTLIAASQQILLTVFANANVQTATVTLNGDTVGNMGVSNSINAKPTDYVFTRTEIETYMSEHTYGLP